MMVPVRFPGKKEKPPTRLEEAASFLIAVAVIVMIIFMMRACAANHQAEKRMCADPQTRAQIEHCATKGKISAWWLLLLL